MDKDFKEIVKQKTKDELVRILINKDEYKNELIEAATEELKLRDKETTGSLSILIDSSQIPSPTFQTKETPLGIYLGGILLFITSAIWIFIGFFQAGISTFSDNTPTGLIAIWNIIASVLSIVFGIGVIKGKKWGYECGLGTAIVSILWFGFWYFQSDWMFYLFLIITEVIIGISLLLNKDYFIKTILVPNNLKLKVPKIIAENNSGTNSFDDSTYKSHVIRLNSLVIVGKNNLFGNSNTIEIRNLLKDLCPNKDSALYLIKVYQEIYSTDLINDLKGLTNNYSSIKEYLEIFIDFSIVTKQYPYDRLN